MTICPSVASLALLGVFLAFMATGIIVIAVTYLRGAIYLSHLQELILAMLAVYSVPLGTSSGASLANAVIWTARPPISHSGQHWRLRQSGTYSSSRAY